MSHRPIFVLACVRALACTLALGVLASACRKAEDVPPPPSPAVLTQTIHSRQEPALTRRGSVVSGARLKLGFNAPGVVGVMKVKTGDVVKKGQLLARLRDADAAAALRAARATSLRAQRDFRAADTLATAGAVPENQREDARSALHVAEANASLAAETFGQRELVAPIAGTVLQRLAEPGEAVGPGLPVLVLEDTQRLVVEVGVNERELSRIAVRKPCHLVLDGTGAEVAAAVTSIAPAPGDDGLYAIEVAPAGAAPALATAPLAFRPGTLLTVRFDDADAASAVRVPIDALVHRLEKTWVFVIGGVANDPHARMREINVERADGKDVLVRNGLKEGDRIVREGAQFLLDDQKVRLLD